MNLFYFGIGKDDIQQEYVVCLDTDKLLGLDSNNNPVILDYKWEVAPISEFSVEEVKSFRNSGLLNFYIQKDLTPVIIDKESIKLYILIAKIQRNSLDNTKIWYVVYDWSKGIIITETPVTELTKHKGYWYRIVENRLITKSEYLDQKLSEIQDQVNKLNLIGSIEPLKLRKNNYDSYELIHFDKYFNQKALSIILDSVDTLENRCIDKIKTNRLTIPSNIFRIKRNALDKIEGLEELEIYISNSSNLRKVDLNLGSIKLKKLIIHSKLNCGIDINTEFDSSELNTLILPDNSNTICTFENIKLLPELTIKGVTCVTTLIDESNIGTLRILEPSVIGYFFGKETAYKVFKDCNIESVICPRGDFNYKSYFSDCKIGTLHISKDISIDYFKDYNERLFELNSIDRLVADL